MNNSSKRNRPKNAKHGNIYFIKHNSGACKIGITLNWKGSSKELKVNSKFEILVVKEIERPFDLEQSILIRYEKYRLPSTEYLTLSEKQIEDIKDEIFKASERYRNKHDLGRTILLIIFLSAWWFIRPLLFWSIVLFYIYLYLIKKKK